MGVSLFSKMVIASKNVIDKCDYEGACKIYKDPDYFEGFTPEEFSHMRAVELSYVSSLANKIHENDGSLNELSRLILYAYLCMDAAKRQINLEKAYDGLKIKELMDKYMQ